MTYSLREGRQKDIPALAVLFQRTVRLSNSHDYDARQIEAWASRGTNNRFIELFKSGLHFFLAERKNEIIGFTAVSAHGFVHSLFVSPESQRQGIAHALIAEATGFSKRHGAATMTTEASITARPFFQSMGFEVVREQEVTIGSVVLKNFRMQKSV